MLGWDAIGAIAGIIAVFGMAVGGTVRLYLLRSKNKTIAESAHVFEEKGFEWLLEKELSYVDLLKRLIAIDVASIEHLDFDDPAEGTAEQWAPVFEYSKNTWRLIIYNGMTIAAYWQAVSLKPSAVQRLKRGSLKDSGILIKDIRSLDDEGDHYLYLIYIGKHPDYEKKFGVMLFKMLMRSIANFCEDLDNRGIVIKEVFANGQSKEGIMLCHHMHMRDITTLSQGGPLFQASYSELNWKLLKKY
jgi:hypothetical protein